MAGFEVITEAKFWHSGQNQPVFRRSEVRLWRNCSRGKSRLPAAEAAFRSNSRVLPRTDGLSGRTSVDSSRRRRDSNLRRDHPHKSKLTRRR